MLPAVEPGLDSNLQSSCLILLSTVIVPCKHFKTDDKLFIYLFIFYYYFFFFFLVTTLILQLCPKACPVVLVGV